MRAGGVLVADVRPAIYDGHVKPLAKGQLDDVFGIRRTGFDNALRENGQVTVALERGGQETLDLGKIRVDAGVRADDASAAGTAGEAPLFLTNLVERGRAVLLNLPMSSYPALGSEGTPEIAARLWRTILESAQVSPAVMLTDDKGRRLRNVEITRWTNGPVQIISVFRHKGQAEPARMTLHHAMHAYDLKRHKSLGKKQTFRLTITPFRAMFFVLSPQRIKPVALKTEGTVASGGVQRLTITSSLPQGQQAVKVRVTLPDGTIADWVDSPAIVDNEGATIDVPVAFNDPKGTWTVRATDLYTGKTTKTSFRVR